MNELDFLREMFKDTRTHIGMGLITLLGPSLDGSILRVKVRLIPEDRDIVALMCFNDVYDVTFPEVNDLAIVAFAEGHDDDAHVIKIVNTKEEPIPLFALLGHSVHYSRPGKKNYFGSFNKICLARPGIEPTQPLVLGSVLQTLLSNVLTQMASLTGQVNSLRAETQAIATELAGHVHGITTPVPVTPGVVNSLPPVDAAAFTGYAAAIAALTAAITAIQVQLNAYKTSPVNDGTILSNIAFTEKGLLP